MTPGTVQQTAPLDTNELLAMFSASWFGSAERVAVELDRVLTTLGLPWRRPTVRTIRLWRTRGLLSDSSSRAFQGRQILESLAIIALQERGWSLAAIGDLLPRLTDEAIASRTVAGTAADWGIGSSAPLPTVDRPLDDRDSRLTETAEVGIILLSQGVLRLYDRILSGRDIVRQDDSLPPELHRAMCNLGKLYIEEGTTDKAACIHEVLDRSRYAFSGDVWGLRIFNDSRFRFRDAVLIDSELRVPTRDAMAIAAIGGSGLDDVIENRLHARLRDTVERLGPKRHKAYTAIRELVARKSLVTEAEIIQWFEQRGITSIQPIIDDLYDRVSDTWLIDGLANQCSWCGTLLRPHPDRQRFPEGKCPLRQCAAKHDARASRRLPPVGLLVCRPQVLAYWTGPGIDELLVYDAARRANLDASLYPDGDRCDISIGGNRIGIDVKCYSSPVSLALKLNRAIGGLSSYERRIIAIGADFANIPGYLDTLKSCLDTTGYPATLEVRTVEQVIQLLVEGSNHDAN